MDSRYFEVESELAETRLKLAEANLKLVEAQKTEHYLRKTIEAIVAATEGLPLGAKVDEYLKQVNDSSKTIEPSKKIRRKHPVDTKTLTLPFIEPAKNNIEPPFSAVLRIDQATKEKILWCCNSPRTIDDVNYHLGRFDIGLGLTGSQLRLLWDKGLVLFDGTKYYAP